MVADESRTGREWKKNLSKFETFGNRKLTAQSPRFPLAQCEHHLEEGCHTIGIQFRVDYVLGQSGAQFTDERAQIVQYLAGKVVHSKIQ